MCAADEEASVGLEEQTHGARVLRPTRGPPVSREGISDRALFGLLDAKPNLQAPQVVLANNNENNNDKKRLGLRLWMRLSAAGESEFLKLDRSEINKLVSIPARDLRILGPVFSHSSSILARDKAMVVNLEFIKVIVTAQEVLILDPNKHVVLSFIDKLRGQLFLSKASENISNSSDKETKQAREFGVNDNKEHQCLDFIGSTKDEFPFEFQVLEIALEVVCGFLGKKVAELEQNAYLILDALTRNVSTNSLEHVRILKGDITRFLARVQKVRDEIEHLLDNDDDMAHVYLTRKHLLSQQMNFNTTLTNLSAFAGVPHSSSSHSSNASNISMAGGHNVEELEMLLEAYFIQIDTTQKKLLTVREYVEDTEDYVNIQLDHQRNELIQLHLTLGVLAFSISIVSGIVGAFAMNIPCPFYSMHGVFAPFVAGTIAFSVVIFFAIFGYAWWKRHFTA